MIREQIEQAAKEAVQNYFPCNGKYPCEERNYCKFCNGYNSAFDCDEDCSADDFNEGFIDGAQWRINSVWHDMVKEEPQVYGDYWNVDCEVWDDEQADDFECKKDKIEKWAYLDDLLPERKEDAE